VGSWHQLFNLIAVGVIAVISRPAFAESGGAACVLSAMRSSLGSAYHVMPRLQGDGSLEALRTELPDLAKMGNQTLWIGPVHPQTMLEHSGGVNNHGYWPSDHGTVDPALGGDEQFKKLVNEAHRLGMNVCLDAVLDHFGYADSVVIDGKTVRVNDPKYFRQDHSSAKSDRALFDELNVEEDPAKIESLLHELSGRPLFGMPTLKHDSPEVTDYLVRSYERFVDLGVDSFRIDAAKHMSREFLYDFTRRLTEYARARGKKVQFLWEFIARGSPLLSTVAHDALAHVPVPANTMFLDFPLAYELRRLQDKDYQFSWLSGFLKYRQEQHQPLQSYVPMIENHDFFEPIRDPFVRKASYALSEFSSYHPTILQHGTEKLDAVNGGRQHVTGFAADGEIAALRNRLSELLEPTRRPSNQSPLRTIAAEGDFLVIERKAPDGRSLLLVINKSDRPLSREFALPAGARLNPDPVQGTLSGSVALNREGDAVHCEIAPKSMAVFFVNQL
jgi:hypothetical protein